MFCFQFFGDASQAEQKMVRLIDDLNNVYDVQAIPDRGTAEERLAKLSVSVLMTSDFCILTTLCVGG